LIKDCRRESHQPPVLSGAGTLPEQHGTIERFVLLDEPILPKVLGAPASACAEASMLGSVGKDTRRLLAHGRYGPNRKQVAGLAFSHKLRQTTDV